MGKTKKWPARQEENLQRKKLKKMFQGEKKDK